MSPCLSVMTEFWILSCSKWKLFPPSWDTDSGDPQVTRSLHPRITELPPGPSRPIIKHQLRAQPSVGEFSSDVLSSSWWSDYLLPLRDLFHFQPLQSPLTELWEILTILYCCKRPRNCALSCSFIGTKSSNHPTAVEPDVSALNLPVDSPIVFAIFLRNIRLRIVINFQHILLLYFWLCSVTPLLKSDM